MLNETRYDAGIDKNWFVIEYSGTRFPGTNIYHLQLKTYTSSAYATKGSWMLLEDRPLGVGDGEQVRQPRAHRKVGRPRVRRFTKAAGPLGRPIRKGKKRTHKK